MFQLMHLNTSHMTIKQLLYFLEKGLYCMCFTTSVVNGYKLVIIGEHREHIANNHSNDFLVSKIYTCCMSEDCAHCRLKTKQQQFINKPTTVQYKCMVSKKTFS